MSKTQFVKYAGHGFWAYDVAVGVFLKYLLDVAQSSEDANLPWLSEAISNWRVWAVISDFGFTLDECWSSEERKTFTVLADEACVALASRHSIASEEIVSWSFVDDLRIHPRGAEEVRTAPVVELGRAIIALISGELSEAPEGKIWLYGTPTGRDTLDVWKGPHAES